MGQVQVVQIVQIQIVQEELRLNTTNKYSNHPKGALYQTLKDTITQREAQLKRMSKNDPDRINFQNELVTAKRKLEEMKDKYKFENFKYLNSFESYNESIEESKNIILNGVDFGIKYSDLSELMYEITDEFQGLNWFMINSNMSAIILDSPNSFVIELFGKGEFPSQLPNLYYLEPKIHNLIGHINDQLGRFGLEVYFSDFGQNDAYYEIVITKKGNKPRMNPDKFEVSSDGEISYKD